MAVGATSPRSPSLLQVELVSHLDILPPVAHVAGAEPSPVDAIYLECEKVPASILVRVTDHGGRVLGSPVEESTLAISYLDGLLSGRAEDEPDVGGHLLGEGSIGILFDDSRFAGSPLLFSLSQLELVLKLLGLRLLGSQSLSGIDMDLDSPEKDSKVKT